MDIAVYFTKIEIGVNLYIFKPVNVVRGIYYEDTNEFETDYGDPLESINGIDINYEHFFAFPTKIDSLKRAYGEDLSEELLISEYYKYCLDSNYIGYYNYDKGQIETKQVDLSDLIMNYNEIQNGSAFTQEIPEDAEELTGILLDLDNLNDMRDLKTVKEFREYVDGLIEFLGAKPEKESKLALKKEESKKFDLTKLRKEVLSNIIGQDEAVNDVTRTLALNSTSKNPRNKSHILITGPSGTGKTEMINVIAKELGIPYFKADATAYTKAGYVGKDVQGMLTGLVTAAGNDLKAAQNGILVIDEIDKKSSSSSDDVSGKSVLHSMLKILDRDIIEVDIDHQRGQKLMFDTSNLTVILMGSFDELYAQKKKYKKKTVGFNNPKEEEKEENIRITEDDLVKWLGPEFVGRIGLVTSTNSLKVEDVVRILKKSKISQLNIVKDDLKDRGITLKYTSGYITEIAKKGLSETTGVRKLNKVVKENMKYAYDEILTRKDVKVLRLTKETALNPKKYYLQ